MTEHLEKLLAGGSLTKDEAADAADAIVDGAHACQAAALLALLKRKGETADEIAGFVLAMRRRMRAVRPPPDARAIDIVGTGGDGHHTVNISTAASIVAAACGAVVAKHGNRSVSSLCGSADVLDEVGVVLELSPAAVERCLAEAGIAFMFAPAFHPAMKHVSPVRKALGVRTLFNILGPLINPASCTRGVIGVFSEALVAVVADALHALGGEHVLVLHCCGLDELAPIGVAHIATVRPEGVELGTLDPTKLGFSTCTIEDLRGGDRVSNARSLRQVLGGELPGPIADTVALNAGAGLYVAGKANSMQEGCDMARRAISEGSPLKVLEQWAACSVAAAAALPVSE